MPYKKLPTTTSPTHNNSIHNYTQHTLLQSHTHTHTHIQMRHIEHTNYIHINCKRMHENLYLTKRIEKNMRRNFYLQADTTIKDAIDVYDN